MFFPSESDVLPPQTLPLFEALPLSEAMSQLVVEQPTGRLGDVVQKIITDEPVATCPTLASALWLYVDELDRSHRISQGLHHTTGSFWHGIMHRREGDFSNSHYWFRRVGKHPVIDQISAYEPHRFIDEVADAHGQDESPSELIELQRNEWVTFFRWCIKNPDQ